MGHLTSRYPRWVIVGICTLTCLWLALHLAAGIRQADRPYPITGFAMFSHEASGLAVELQLVGECAEGERTRLTPDDFGLTQLQLRAYLGRNVVPGEEVSEEVAEARLARLAEIWSARHGRDLESVTLLRIEHWVDRPDVEMDEVAAWSE